MKKTLILLASAFALFVAAGCSNEAQGPELVPMKKVTLGAEVIETKANLDSEGAFSWNEGDQIAAYATDGNFYTMTLQSGAGSDTGSFEGEIPQAANLTDVAVYPVSAAKAYDATTGKLTYNFASEYDYQKGVTQVPLIAKLSADATSASFKQVGGVIRFTFTDLDPNIIYTTESDKRFRFSFSSNIRITGDYEVDINAESPAITGEVLETPSTVTVTCDSPTSAINTFVYNIPVPAGTYKPFTAKLLRTDSDVENFWNRTVNSSKNSITPGKLLIMPSLSPVLSEIGGEVTITDPTVLAVDRVEFVVADADGAYNVYKFREKSDGVVCNYNDSTEVFGVGLVLNNITGYKYMYKGILELSNYDPTTKEYLDPPITYDKKKENGNLVWGTPIYPKALDLSSTMASYNVNANGRCDYIEVIGYVGNYYSSTTSQSEYTYESGHANDEAWVNGQGVYVTNSDRHIWLRYPLVSASIASYRGKISKMHGYIVGLDASLAYTVLTDIEEYNGPYVVIPGSTEKTVSASAGSVSFDAKAANNVDQLVCSLEGVTWSYSDGVFTVNYPENTAEEDRNFTIADAEGHNLVTILQKKAAGDSSVDVLNYEWTGITGTNYTEASDLIGSASGANYTVQAAGGNESIQLRSNNSNSGIVTTTSGGKLVAVTVKWNSNTADARVLNIYASNTPYSSPSDLYNSASQGTLVASFTKSDGDGEYTFVTDYAYIGIRSNSGALYLDEITIAWEAGSAPSITPLAKPSNVSAVVDAATVNTVVVSWNAVENAGSYAVTLTPENGSPVSQNVTTATATFTELSYNTEYTVTVIAKPTDTSAYSNSVASDPVTVTTGQAEVPGLSLPFVETFAGSGGHNTGFSGSDGDGAISYDNEGWTGEKAFGADNAAKFGTGSVLGTATSPLISYSGDATLTFKAAAWSGDQTTLKISTTSGTLYGDYACSTEISEVSIPNAAWGSKTVYIKGISGSFQITFEGYQASKSRFFLDDINIVSGLVEPAPVTLESIAVSGQTTSFTVGDTFSFGGAVTATYSDGTTADVTSSATYSGYDMSTAGSQTVTVSYTEDSITKATSYSITVSSTGGDKTNQVLFHETFGDNSGSARNWNDTYSVKSGVNAVYSGITGYSITNAKQGKNTTGSTKSGLYQATQGKDAVLIIGPLAVASAENMVLTYQWKAGSIKGTYFTKLFYATSSTGAYTEVTGSGNGATSFVERSYTLPTAAQVNTLYLKIVWNTSNTQAIIDEVNLQGDY